MMKNWFFALLVLLASCGDKNALPKGVLQQEKMKQVLMDVIKAEAYTAEIMKKDSSKNATEENARLQQQVFAIHKVSKEDFYKSFDYYRDHSEIFKVMLDSMVTQGYKSRNLPPVPSTIQPQ